MKAIEMPPLHKEMPPFLFEMAAFYAIMAPFQKLSPAGGISFHPQSKGLSSNENVFSYGKKGCINKVRNEGITFVAGRFGGSEIGRSA